MVKNSLAMQETWVQPLSWEGSLEKEMATHFSILAWKITWTEEPGGLQSIVLQRVGHDLMTENSKQHFCQSNKINNLNLHRAVGSSDEAKTIWGESPTHGCCGPLSLRGLWAPRHLCGAEPGGSPVPRALELSPLPSPGEPAVLPTSVSPSTSPAALSSAGVRG